MMARILLVDDETNIRTMVRLALIHAGHMVETAADGDEGLKRFGDGSGVDLVLLDQRMPGMNGLEVLREMRRRNPAARVIMATAFGTIDLAVDAMKAGATDFVRKPFTNETLQSAVSAALTSSPQPGGGGVTFGSTTINGFRIQFDPSTSRHDTTGYRQQFQVRSPDGVDAGCLVVLPSYLIELVKARTDRETLPGGDRFWQALCEEALANYIWQHAEPPVGGRLRVEELSSGLRRFVDAVLAP
ncbi:MAG: response regulator [Armatimonadetes bacterium]|nr:response regulator [Armatimonadota bacterium]MDE2207248.1 response regulator [Armatimonadota bacterium]